MAPRLSPFTRTSAMTNPQHIPILFVVTKQKEAGSQVDRICSRGRFGSRHGSHISFIWKFKPTWRSKIWSLPYYNVVEWSNTWSLRDIVPSYFVIGHDLYVETCISMMIVANLSEENFWIFYICWMIVLIRGMLWWIHQCNCLYMYCINMNWILWM